MNPPKGVVCIDPGLDSGIALFDPLHSQILVRAYKAIEINWASERWRADLVAPIVRGAELVVIEDGAHFMSQQAARGFERSQTRWDGALRLLSVDPVYMNVATWHAQLKLRSRAEAIETDRVNSGLRSLRKGERLKVAVADFLKEEINHVAATHNEGDALAMAVAVHRGLTTGELVVEGSSGRRRIVLNRSRARSARKRAAG